MARRKIKNVERDFLFNFPTPGGESEIKGSFYVDMMQCHSLVNRVFARQGMNTLIQSIEIGVRTGGAYTCSILRLPQHWSCVNAWTKAMTHWKKQQDERADETGLESTRARYRDFKVYFDSTHAAAGLSLNLIPQGFITADAGNPDSYYDWIPSEVVLPNDGAPGNTTERTLHMLGPDAGATSAGVIAAYAESRSRPFGVDPNIVDVPQGGLFGQMMDVGDDTGDIISNYQDRNDQPPYMVSESVPGAQFEYYPGGSIQGIGPVAPTGGNTVEGQFVDTLAVNANQNYNSDGTGQFAAPCGLLKFEMQATGVGIFPGSVDPGEAVGGPLWMRIRLAPGYYQGIAAVPMQEAN